MRVSIVIPTYNSGAKLGLTLDHVLAGDIAGLDGVEVIVVDDGSAEEAGPLVAARTVRRGFSLSSIRQENSGPAAARNRGFCASSGEIVIFIDDDILVPEDLVQKHVDAHRARPRAVIYGRCPLIEPVPITPLYRYVVSRGYDLGEGSTSEFLETEVVASGQISFERTMFSSEGAVYRDDMQTPAAEEYELAARLKDRNVPIIMGTKIVAWHNHAITLDSMCRQAFKHAKGCAEAAAKCPATLRLQYVKRVIRANQPARLGDAPGLIFKGALKRLLSAGLPLAALRSLVKCIERRAPGSPLLPALYSVVLGLYGFAGVRAGFEQYSEGAGAKRRPEPG